jgi:hypothetical protein
MAVPAVPVGAQLLALARAAVHARDGLAWLVIRILLAAAGLLCLRPVLGALKTAPAAPAPVAVRRVRA